MPFVCLMMLQPMLRIGPRESLSLACDRHAVELEDAHCAWADAYAAARLWPVYLKKMKEKRIHTFGDLLRLRRCKFLRSFEHKPISATSLGLLPFGSELKSRRSGALL